MSEQSDPEYPAAWGVGMIQPDGVVYWETCYVDEQEAHDIVGDLGRGVVVKLIPQPTVNRLIAEAEQRGRDAGIKEACGDRRKADVSSLDFNSKNCSRDGGLFG